MAEVNDPAGDAPAENGRRVARPADEPETGEVQPRLLQPPTEEELAEQGEPSADEIHTAAGSGAPAAEEPVDPMTRRLDSVPPDPVEEPEERVEQPREAAAPAAEAVPAAERAPAEEPASAAEPSAAPITPYPERGTEAAAPPPPPAPPVPMAAPPVEPLEPADEQLPPPPKVRGNRVVGTAWVVLAAGIFQVLFFAANALVALVFGGTAAVVPQMQSIAGTALAWLPVLLFFLLFFLTVLISGRAGRIAYVFSSLIVGAAVYVATVLLFSLIVRHTLGDANTLAQTFLNWEFILIGLVARETMLWTGLAVGSRGIRVRQRNREEKQRYEAELADARA